MALDLTVELVRAKDSLIEELSQIGCEPCIKLCDDYIVSLENTYGIASISCQVHMEEFGLFLKRRELFAEGKDVLSRRINRLKNTAGESDRMVGRTMLLCANLTELLDNNFKDSYTLLKEAVEILEKGNYPAEKTAAVALLAFVTWHLNEKEKSEEYCEIALLSFSEYYTDLENIVPRDPNIEIWYVALRELGEVCRLQHKFDSMERLYKVALLLSQKNDDLTNISQAQSQIAFACNQLNKREEALQMCKNTLTTIREICLQPLEMKCSARRIVHHLDRIAFISYCMEDYELSQKLYIESLKLQQEHLGENHPNMARIASTIALHNLKQKGDNQITEKYQNIAINVLRELLDFSEELETGNKNIVELIDALKGVGQIFSRQRKLDKAEEYLNRALELSKKYFGPSHDRTAKIYQIMGNCFSKARNNEKAIENLEKALEIMRHSMTDFSSYIINAESALNRCKRFMQINSRKKY